MRFVYECECFIIYCRMVSDQRQSILLSRRCPCHSASPFPSQPLSFPAPSKSSPRCKLTTCTPSDPTIGFCKRGLGTDQWNPIKYSACVVPNGSFSKSAHTSMPYQVYYRTMTRLSPVVSSSSALSSSRPALVETQHETCIRHHHPQCEKDDNPAAICYRAKEIIGLDTYKEPG